MFKNARSFALGAVVAALALSSVPALSGSHGAGSIQLLGVGDTPIASGVTSFAWQWLPGSAVSSDSVVDLRLVDSTTGSVVMRKYRYVRWGAYSWDTTRTSDGLYTVTAWLRSNPSVSSTYGPVYVDNTAPEVGAITQPAYTGIVLKGASVTPETRVVAGPTTLAADATDNLTGVARVEWWLDHGTESAAQLDATANEDGTYSYDFTAIAPGEHTLTAIAIDRAGNTSDANTSVDLLVLGTGAGAPGVPDPGSVLPTEDPDPQPSPEPTLPEIPELPDPNDPSTLPEVPQPEPTEPEVPSVPEPDPSSTPQPPIPLPLP